MIVDGWLDKAIKMPGRPISVGAGFNSGVNAVKGLVFHSAEGFAGTLLDPRSQWGYYSAEFPWHFSNLLDGRLIQHYPMTARCWHGSAFNQDYVGIEHEGRSPEPGKGPLLNAAQIENDRILIAEVSAWKGWEPKRPAFVGDKTATLYEHKETVWFGGTSTSCPNNRIPWERILGGPAVTPEEELELADRRALALAIDAMSFGQGGDGGIYRPVAVAEANGQLLIELWTRDRRRPPEPVPSFWVKKPQ